MNKFAVGVDGAWPFCFFLVDFHCRWLMCNAETAMHYTHRREMTEYLHRRLQHVPFCSCTFCFAIFFLLVFFLSNVFLIFDLAAFYLPHTYLREWIHFSSSSFFFSYVSYFILILISFCFCKWIKARVRAHTHSHVQRARRTGEYIRSKWKISTKFEFKSHCWWIAAIRNT